MKVNHSGRVRVPTFWHLLSQAGRSVVSLNVPGTFPPLDVRGRGRLGHGRARTSTPPSRRPPSSPRRLRGGGARLQPALLLEACAPNSLEELAENARLTAESFRGRAEGGLLADRMVPDWSALMVQFQNLDPFQHRAWRYLNVDETGIDRPRLERRGRGRCFEGSTTRSACSASWPTAEARRVLVVSDHGFGPCLGRIHVNRILIDAGVARLPGLAGRLRRRAKQAARPSAALGREARRSRRRGPSSFDLSVAAQFPFDWKRTLAFAPHQDTAAMVYLNSAARRAGRPAAAPSARSTTPAPRVAQALAEARHPETGDALFPTDHRHGRGLQARPRPRRLSRPDRPARRALLGPHQARARAPPGSRPTPNLPGTHRPEGIVALAGAGIAPGRTLQADLRDIAPTILKLFGLPIPATSRASPLACLGEAPAPRSPRRAARPADRRPASARSSTTRPRSRRSSSSGWPTSATWNRIDG